MENSVLLNGINYTLKEGTKVTREPITDFSASTRQQSQQKREDRALMSSWQFGEFMFGGGIQRMDIDNDRDMTSYWRSTVDTRWRGKVMLPPLITTCTFGTSSIVGLGKMLADNAQIYMLGKVPSAADVSEYAWLKWTAPDQFNYYNPIIPTGTTEDITNLLAATWDEDTGKYLYYLSKSNLAGIFEMSNLVTGSLTMLAQTRASIVPSGYYAAGFFHKHVGTWHVGIIDKTLHKAFIHPVMSGTIEESSEFYRADYYTPPQLAHTPDGFFSGRSSGVDLINFAQRTYTEKISLDAFRSDANTVGMCAWGNEYLMVPYRDPRGLGGIMAFNTVNQVTVQVGLNLDDGVPNGWSPEVSAIIPTPEFIFAAHAPPISSYPSYRYGQSRVMAYDGYGWHFMCEVPTQSGAVTIHQMLMSLGGNGIPKLFMSSVLDPAYYVTMAPWHIQYPLTHPLMQVGYEFATMGDLELPIFNGGMPEFKCGFYEYMIEADTLGSERQIEVFYGLNGATPTQSLGVATISGTRIMQFGNGLGVEAYSIQMMMRFSRGTDKNYSPVLITHHSPVLNYIKYPGNREIFKFTIDMDKTHRNNFMLPETIMTNLDALRNSAVMVPFYYGNIGTKNVHLAAWGSTEQPISAGLIQMENLGAVEVALVEIL